MGRNGQSARHHPIQTSAVIVLGAQTGPALLPSSPPTPCASPTHGILVVEQPLESFSLEQPSQFSQEPASSHLLAASCRKESPATETRLRRGIHVLQTEAVALTNLAKLYETDAIVREEFNQAVQTIAHQGSRKGGKLVIIGVGKSGHIGKKLVATMQSLDIRAVFLHPTEALHGDLGVIDSHDTLMFITYSGKTPELMLLLPHLDDALPTILLTSHIRRDTCELIQRRPRTILLSAPIHESESNSFGVSAPTSSTTVALALGDALAITAASEMHRNVAATFAKNHPGGAIGAAATSSAIASAAASTAAAASTTTEAAATATKSPQILKDICVLVDDIPCLQGLGLTWMSQGIELLRAGVDSKSGWIGTQDEQVASPSRIREISTAALQEPLSKLADVFIPLRDVLAMSSDTSIRKARDMVRSASARQKNVGEETLPCRLDVIGVTEGGKMTGVLEARHLFKLHGSDADAV